jgi:hypothetical protein
MKKYIIISIIILVIILIVIFYSKQKEHYLSGVLLQRLDVQIPKRIKPGFMNYQSYSDIDYKALCPSHFSNKIQNCQTKTDCDGRGEVCMFTDESLPGYCTCSIQNACMDDAVC